MSKVHGMLAFSFCCRLKPPEHSAAPTIQTFLGGDFSKCYIHACRFLLILLVPRSPFPSPALGQSGERQAPIPPETSQFPALSLRIFLTIIICLFVVCFAEKSFLPSRTCKYSSWEKEHFQASPCLPWCVAMLAQEAHEALGPNFMTQNGSWALRGPDLYDISPVHKWGYQTQSPRLEPALSPCSHDSFFKDFCQPVFSLASNETCFFKTNLTFIFSFPSLFPAGIYVWIISESGCHQVGTQDLRLFGRKLLQVLGASQKPLYPQLQEPSRIELRLECSTIIESGCVQFPWESHALWKF